MKAWLDLYRAHLVTSLAVMFHYRAEMFIWMIGRVVEPVIYLVVWTTVARSHGGRVGGYAIPEFAAYYLILMVVNWATFSWIMFEFEHRIRQGALSSMLLRPVHPWHSDLADNIAYKLVTLVILVPSVLLLSLLFTPSLPLEAWRVALLLPALGLAFIMRFLFEWTLAQAAFWTTRVDALNQLYFFVLVFFSGRVAPVSLFPETLGNLARASPFYWMVGFPTELLLGKVSLQEAGQGLAVQAAYAALSGALLRLLWRASLRKYSAVGG